MKSLFAGLTAAALLMLAPAALHAQTRTIAYGRTSVTFTPAFNQALAAQGVVISDLTTLQPLQNGVDTFTGIEGVLDLNTALGEVVFAGGYQVVVNGQTIAIQDLAFQISTPTTATVSGIFTVNGTFLSRQTIFVVNMDPHLTLPLQVQNGTLTLPMMSLGLAPYFVSLINQAAGQQIFNAGTQVATANEFAVFAPTTPTGIN